MIGSLADAILTLGGSIEMGVLVKITVTLLIGLTAARIARRARAAVRHLLLTSTFGALVALLMLAGALPPWSIALPVRAAAAHGVASSRGIEAVAVSPVSKEIHTVSVANGTLLRPGWRRIVWLAWAAGAALFLASFCASLVRLRSIRRRGIPSPEGSTLARMLTPGDNPRRSVEVLLHERIEAPLTCGVWKPVILLPTDSADWTDVDLRRALVHELEHVRRRDWAIQLAARAICGVFWFHPLVWVAWRKLCVEAERACDDAVVAGADGTEYAGQLIALARRLSRSVQPALGMANRSDLATRVSALLDVDQRRGRAGFRPIALTAGVAAAAVLAIAPLRAVPASDNGPQAGQHATVSGLTPSRTESPRPTRLDLWLYEAAERGDIKRMTALVDRGANVNAAIDGDGSPLIGAARSGSIRAVQLLLERGADPGMPVSGDGNPLIVAAGEGHADIVQLLLDYGAGIDEIVPGDENALIRASAEGQLAVVKLLVSRGADVNARAWSESYPGREGEWRTPLSMAMKAGHREVAEFLRSEGAR